MASQSVGEKLGLDRGTHELKLGKSFEKTSTTAFHSIRYDFKPASVDTNKESTVQIGSDNYVTVTVPHVERAGKSHTVYKGNKKPVQKECVLIINHDTGEITLEKLSNAILLKKTRQESSSKLNTAQRPVTPIDHKKNSPTIRAPTKPLPSMARSGSTPQQATSLHKSPANNISPDKTFTSALEEMEMDMEISSQSSSGSSSDSNSDSEDSNNGDASETQKNKLMENYSGRVTSMENSVPTLPTQFMHTLSQDLRLSDSSSDDSD